MQVDETLITLLVGAVGGTVAAMVKGSGDRRQYAREAMLSASRDFLDTTTPGLRKMIEFDDLWYSEGPYRDVTTEDFDRWAAAMLTHRNAARIAFSPVQLFFGTTSAAALQAHYVVAEMGLAYELFSSAKSRPLIEDLVDEIQALTQRLLGHHAEFANEAGARVRFGALGYWTSGRLKPWWHRRRDPSYPRFP